MQAEITAKKCPNCGREFEGWAQRKFCSNACRQAWYRQGQLDKRLREAPHAERGGES